MNIDYIETYIKNTLLLFENIFSSAVLFKINIKNSNDIKDIRKH